MHDAYDSKIINYRNHFDGSASGNEISWGEAVETITASEESIKLVSRIRFFCPAYYFTFVPPPLLKSSASLNQDASQFQVYWTLWDERWGRNQGKRETPKFKKLIGEVTRKNIFCLLFSLWMLSSRDFFVQYPRIFKILWIDSPFSKRLTGHRQSAVKFCFTLSEDIMGTTAECDTGQDVFLW